MQIVNPNPIPEGFKSLFVYSNFPNILKSFPLSWSFIPIPVSITENFTVYFYLSSNYISLNPIAFSYLEEAFISSSDTNTSLDPSN